MATTLDGGPGWLAALPAIVEELAGRWGVQLGLPYLPGGLNSWVAPVTRADGEPAVLKVTVPHDEARHEIDALTAWNGGGAVALLEHDRDAWAVLLERCEPGSSLLAARLGETETADVVARVLGELWTAPIDGPFSDIGEEMTRQAERLPDLAAHWPATVAPDLVNRALRHLEAGPDTSRRVLLHRDLHGENILLSARGWLAIDPKPWVGEPACDLAAAIVSGAPADVEALAQRLELGADRVREHAIALAVVLALWSRSVGRDGGAIRLAERAAVLAEN